MMSRIRSAASWRKNRLVENAARRGGMALVGMDEILRGVVHSKGPAAADETHDSRPTGIFAVISHWRPDSERAAAERIALLERCLDGLLHLQAEQIVAVVLTNKPQMTGDALSDRRDRGGAPIPARIVKRASLLPGPWEQPRELIVLGWHPGLVYRHGYYLTWGHIPVLRRAARTDRFSHLIYLEDDMRFTEQHLNYWCRYRAPLKQVGLLPGFVRFEWHEKEKYLVDVSTPLDPARCRRAIPTHGDLCSHAVALHNPYQAMYLLDRALIGEHFRFSRSRSPLRSRASSTWNIRERAAAGPIFDDVPAGLRSRNVVPVRTNGSSQRLDPCCLIEHVAGTYTDDSTSQFGTLKVDNLFTVTHAGGEPDGGVVP